MFERHRLALVVAASVEFGPPDQRASLRPRDALAQGAFLCEGSTSSSGYQLAVIASTEQTDAGEIREKETKSGKIRTVALPSMAVEELQRWHVTQAQELLRLGVRIDDSWHVVTKADGRPVQPRSLTHVVSAFLEEWGVTLHKLRHSHASHLLAANVHPKVVQERLGHSSIAITMDTYSHLMPNMQSEAAAAVDDVLGEAIKKRVKDVG